MRINHSIALSIVACSVLCGAQNYTDWNGGSFQGGDTVDITYNYDTQTLKLLQGNINLTSGTLTATIKADALKIPGNTLVGNFNGNTITFGSAGSTIIFNISRDKDKASRIKNAFNFNSTNFTAEANLQVNANMQGASVFQAKNGSLTFKGDLKVTGGGTIFNTSGTKLNINQNGGKQVDIQGSFSLSNSTTKIKLDSSDDKIQGNITANNGTTTLDLLGGSKIIGNFTGNGGSSTLDLDIKGSNTTFQGNITNSGTTTIDVKESGTIDGSITTSGNTLTLNMNQGTISGKVTSTASTNTLTGSNNNTIQSLSFTGKTNKWSNTWGAKITITEDASFTANNGGKNTIIIEGGGGVNGKLTTSGTTDITSYSSTSFGSIEHSNGSYTQKMYSSSKIQNGITTKDSATNVNITANGSHILGTSSLGGSNINLILEGNSTGGDITFKGKEKNILYAHTITKKARTSLERSSANAKVNSVNMQGNNFIFTDNNSHLTISLLNMQGSNRISNKNSDNGANLTIIGNATLNAKNGSKNEIAFKSGGVNGTLTTQGITELHLLKESQIQKGVRHSNGNFNSVLYATSQISDGIQTSGTGTATLTLKDNSKLNGDSNFGSTGGNTLTLETSSQINGNTTFSGNTHTLTAGDDSQITGQLISAGGTTTHTLNKNATIIGGIDTKEGATETIATFKGSSQIKNGTSTFHSKIKITFDESSQANNEKFNVESGEAEITFQNKAQMNGGKITTNGGTSNILFKDDSKMQNGWIATNGGESNLNAQDNAILSNILTQSGGTFNATFEGSSAFNGNATQSGGTSNINFKGKSSWTGDFNQSGADSSSTIVFKDTAHMTGNITTTDGTTDITFNEKTKIKGNIKAGGKTNNVTFQGALLDGNLTLDGVAQVNGNSTAELTQSRVTGNIQGYDKVDITITESEVLGFLHQGGSYHTQGMKATITNSHIQGGFQGKAPKAHNELKITNSKIDNGVKQIQGSLTVDADGTIITGGFHGSETSTNKVTMNKGSLEGGIEQNTGSLDFLSKGTSITGGFTGTNSTNTLKMANGNFNDGNIRQSGGSLKADIVSMNGINDFIGDTNSNNVVHLMDTTIKNVSQTSGSLEFQTNTNVEGNITGDRSQNKITVTGANVAGSVSQTSGSMNLYLTNANLNKNTTSITATGARFGLYANSSTIAGGITLNSSFTSGVSNDLTLNGAFNQTGGTSNLTFSNSNFTQTTTITDATSASMIFTKSTIKDISAKGGSTSFNLANSEMGNFTGTNGSHAITLTTSKAGTFTQNNGSLTVNATSTSTTKDITGTNTSLAVSLNSSTTDGSISNSDGNTTIATQNATITGNVSQTGGSLSYNSTDSTLQGKYTQIGGTSALNFANSKIEKGIEVTNLASGTLNFSQKSSIKQGIKSTNSTLSLIFSGASTLTGGFTQIGGVVTGTLNNSYINKTEGARANELGLNLSNGRTTFSLYNDSEINGGITAINNDTTILVDHSKINGDITIDQGKLDLTAQNQSTITSEQMKVENADLKLTIDTSSKFIGNLTQTNNKQEILIKQNSEFQGDITNNNTTGTITINNATLTGSLSQTDGTLGLNLSNSGKIGKDVTLTDATTTLSGTGTDNQIGGNFTQNNGSLTGSMNGLTLKGKYSQTGGTSDVSFSNSVFESDTSITNADKSSLTFINSTLKNYTISGGKNNTLKLLNGTTMTGDLTLKEGAEATLKMQGSTINGNIDASGDSFLTFDTLDSQITGTTTINTGGLKGTANHTEFGGSFTLTDTKSDVSFINKSKITGDITATGNESDNTIQFDDSSLTGSLSQENGKINLDLSNGSSIGKDLTFTSATAHFTGSGTGNRIDGKFDTTETKLTGDVSSLTLAGTFTQSKGTSDIIFRNDSLFKSKVTITEAESSKLNFLDRSGIKAEVSITKGEDNQLSFGNTSFLTGDITINGSGKTNITATGESSITGDLTSTSSNASIVLNNSTFTGNITQTQGSLTLSGANRSSFEVPTFTITGATDKETTTAITLDTNTSFTSENMTATNANVSFSLNNNSSVGATGALSKITLTDSNLTITAQNNSNFNAELKSHAENAGENAQPNPTLKTATLTFDSNSLYNGSIDFKNIKTTANFNQSTLNATSVEIDGGSFDLTYDSSPNGGAIQSFKASNTDLKISALNQSFATIQDLQMLGNTLNLKDSDSSRLTANISLNNNTKATYTAETNGNLNVNTHLLDGGSTLEVTLKGGMLQGTILQSKNGMGFNTGEVTLQTQGDFGGRLAPTDDMQIKSLKLSNNEDVFQSNALFASVFKNPMSYVDFTLDFADTQTSSRLGKEMIVKPQPQEDGIIPPAPEGQTYVRQLQVDTLSGQNGLFRVYTDLGAKLADNILATKASGDHIIQVQYRAETFRDIGGDKIVVAKVTDPNTTVSFKGTQSEIGLTRYDTEIIKENAAGGGFQWIIGQATPSGMSYSSKIIASLLQSQYRNFMIEVDSLDRRMGDLKYIKRDLGLWMRAYVGQNKKDANDFSVSAQDDYYSVWTGIDFNSIGLTVHNFAGIFFNYTGINSESKDYMGKGYNIGIGFYDTFKAFSGFYADFLLKYIYSSSSFEISNYALAKNAPEMSNHKFLLNAEIGYSFYYGEKFKSGYIQPQFQVTSGYIDNISLEMIDVSGETIYGTMARNFPITLRAGVFWGQVFGEKIKSHIKLGSSFAYDVNSGGKLHFQDSSTQLNFKQEGDFRMLFSAQTDFTFSDFFKLYAGIDTSFFGNYNIVYSANFGLRMTFGRANNRVKNVPVVYNPYEPPVIINDDRRTVPVVKRFTTKDINQNYAGKPRKVESQIQGNPVPTPAYGAPSYTPSRKSFRDITDISEVSF